MNHDTACTDVRDAIRQGEYTGQTAGLCPGMLQANIVILPRDHFDEFLDFCLKNPRPCPLVGVSDVGNPGLPDLGEGIDMRTDLPRYVVYRDGENTDEPKDIIDLWQDDFVTFALGCSFTFETALIAAGIPMHHITGGSTVPMFRTGVSTVPNGVFGSDLVVSMRPVSRTRVEDVIEICNEYPFAHGAPIHVGDPAEIGIDDLYRPDWGDPLLPGDDEVCAFWACGVTTQLALMAARLPLAITHKPASMLITETPETQARLLG